MCDGPIIQSLGPPPERYADRMVGEMMRKLAEQRAHHWPALKAVIKGSSDGSPKAQRKLEERIKRSGVITTQLTPGKRGRYKLIFSDMTGWDPAQDTEILLGAPIPEKPWLACRLNSIKSEGRGREHVEFDASPFLFITHHVLSRAAQRFGVRTMPDLLVVTNAILSGALDLFGKKGWDAWLEAPPDGHRVNVRREGEIPATVVLQRYEKRMSLLAATIF